MSRRAQTYRRRPRPHGPYLLPPTFEAFPLPKLAAVCQALGLTESELEAQLRAGAALDLMPTPTGVAVRLRWNGR